MEGINSFEKGLHRSNSPVEQPEGSYVDAYNWVRNDSGRLVNEELEKVIQELTDAKGYEYLGSYPIQNSFICFFKQHANDGNFYSEIGLFEGGVYKRVFNDYFHNYKLYFNNSIDSVARIVNTVSNPTVNTGGDRVVYFVEEGNKSRRFNLDLYQKNFDYTTNVYSGEEYNNEVDWNLQLEFKMPYAEYTLGDRGNLPTGVYSFAFRYRTGNNNKTVFSIPSRFISVAAYSYNGNIPILNDTTTGDVPQVQTNQQITIKLKNVDSNYEYIEPIVITYLDITNQLIIKSLGIFENTGNQEIVFFDESQYGDAVSLADLLESPVFYESAKCIEQKDNTLVISNVNTKKYDNSFQQVANDIELYWEIDKRPVDTRRNFDSYKGWQGQEDYRMYEDTVALHRTTHNLGVFRDYGAGTGTAEDPYNYYRKEQYKINSSDTYFWQPYFRGLYRVWNTNGYEVRQGQGDNHNLTGKSVDISRDLNFQQSNVYADPTLLKGFQRGERYSFSFTPIYKDGSLGFAYHIPGKDYDPNKPNRLAAWISKERYNSSYDEFSYLLGEFIRHHQMPDLDITGGIGDYEAINVLRVRVKNINLTPDQENNIQGYIIGFQPRTSDASTRIVDYGFSRPYLKKEGTDSYYTNVFTGSTLYRSQIKSYEPNYTTNPYAMYHSPDTILNPDKVTSAHYIQRAGYGKNLIIQSGERNIDKNGVWEQYKSYDRFDRYYIKLPLPILASMNSWQNTDVYAYFLFEEGEFYHNIGDLKRITKAEFIPDVGDQNNLTIDNVISVKRTYRYLHLKTDGGHFFDGKNNSITDPKMSYYIYPHLRMDQVDGFSGAYDLFDIAEDHYINISRIINDNPYQYGKLEQAEYTPCLVVMNDQNLEAEQILEGDIFISKYFFSLRDKLQPGPPDSLDVGSMIGMYVESKNNYSLRHTESGKVPFYPNYKYLINTAAPLGIFNLNWYDVSTGYNKQYSSLSNSRRTYPKPLFFKEINEYPNRTVYSNQSFESEIVDQYRIFPSLQFHDVPRHRGKIIDTFVFNNNFFHHTEYGLWQSYFNPNTVQSTTQGSVVLGNAGIFKIPSKLILDIKGGYMGTNDKSAINTPFGRIFLDHYQGKVFLFTDESPTEISDLGLFSFFREFVNTNDSYSMGYDWANKRLLLNNITQKRALSYYPKTQTWTSLHDFSPNAYLTLNGESYAWKDSSNSFYNLKNSDGTRKESYITFVENTSPDAFKRFERIEMNTMSGGKGGLFSPGSIPTVDNYVFLDKSFTSIHCWTDRQNTTELDFAYALNHDYDTNFLNSYNSALVPANYYRSSFHAELPLDAVVDPYKNIFDNSNTDITADFRSHMKGKFLYTKLSYKEHNPLVLNYVKTFFKPTVA